MTRKPYEINDDDAPSAPLWVLTYADLVSLLLAFFVLLVSMSRFREVSHTQAVVSSLQGQFRDPTPWANVFHGLRRSTPVPEDRSPAAQRSDRAEALLRTEATIAAHAAPPFRR